MNSLVDLLDAIVVALDSLLRAATDPQQQNQITQLRDAFDAMSDKAAHNLFDSASDDYANAVKSLASATQAAKDGAADAAKVSAAIATAVKAANAVDKLVGFLAHLP